MTIEDKSVCPLEYAGGLDNKIRRWLQNPQKLISPYIKSGMTVLDLGCGPGFFTIEIARLLADSGKVIAADLQQGMLDKVKLKVQNTLLEKCVTLHKCQEDKIGLDEQVDFVWAFFMIHEVPNHQKLFSELKKVLKPRAKMLIIEPKFHVSKASFENMIEIAENNQLTVIAQPKQFLCWSILVEN